MPCRKSPFDACRTGAHRRQKQHYAARQGRIGGRQVRPGARSGRGGARGRPRVSPRAGSPRRRRGARPRYRRPPPGGEAAPVQGKALRETIGARPPARAQPPRRPQRKAPEKLCPGTGSPRPTGRPRARPRYRRPIPAAPAPGPGRQDAMRKGGAAARMRRSAAAPAQPAPHRSRPRAGPRTAADGGPCPACHPGRRRAARRRRIPHPASRREPECMPGTLASPGPGGIRAQAAPRRRVTAGAGAGPVRAQMSGRRGWAGIGAGGRRRRRVHHCARTSRLRRASGQAAGAVQCAPMCPCTPRPSSTRAAPYPTRDGPGADAARPGLAHVPSSRGRHPLIGGLCAAVHGDRPAGVRCRLHPA